MLQTGALIRDLSVGELVAMVASLYPAPLDVAEALELTGIERDRRPAHAEALRRADPARALRRGARQRRQAAGARRADRGDGRRGPALLLDDDARAGGARQDDPVRHPLPGGGRRLRRPGDADGARRRSSPTVPPTEIKAMVGTRTIRATLPGADLRRARAAAGRQRRRPPRRGGRAELRGLRRGDPRAARRLPRRARHRDRRRRAWRRRSCSSPPRMRPTVRGGGAGAGPAAGAERRSGEARDERARLHPLRAAAHIAQPPLLRPLARVPAGPVLPDRRPHRNIPQPRPAPASPRRCTS